MTAHRAYRLLFSQAQQGSGEVDLGWVKFYGARRGLIHGSSASLTALGGTAIASGATGGSAAAVFNYANSATHYNWYLGGAASGGWIGWDFGAATPRDVKAYSLSPYTSYAPLKWKLQYCDDAGALTNWVDIHEAGPNAPLFTEFTSYWEGENAGHLFHAQPDVTAATGHRFWRVFWPGGQGGSDDLGLQEIKFKSATDSDLVRNWGEMRGSSRTGGLTFTPSRVLDRNTSTAGFTAAQGTAVAQWFAVDLGEKIVVTEVELTHYSTTYYRPLIKVQSSDDGVTWTDRLASTDNIGKAASAITTLTVPSSVSSLLRRRPVIVSM